jgi:hypothetical protein
MSDERLSRTVSAEDSALLGGSTPSPEAREHAELTALADLVSVKDHFELSLEARARGLEQLGRELRARAKRKRPIVPLWWSLPVAAAVLLAWLLPMTPASESAAPTTPALLEAQNAHLTARLTGLHIPRDELEQAQKSYREELLAALEKAR